MTAALEGGEWSAARPGRTLPPGKTRYPFYRRLGEPHRRSERAENLVPTGIRYRTVQPVVNRYTDWATWPTDYTIYYTIIYYTMLCYAILCYGMLQYAMLCYAMLCYTVLYYENSADNTVWWTSTFLHRYCPRGWVVNRAGVWTKPLPVYHEPRLDLLTMVKKHCVKNKGVLFSQCILSLYKNAGRRHTGRARVDTRLKCRSFFPLPKVGRRGGYQFTDQKCILAGDLCFMGD